MLSGGHNALVAPPQTRQYLGAGEDVRLKPYHQARTYRTSEDQGQF